MVTSAAYAQPSIPRNYIEYPGFSLGANIGLLDLWGDIGTKSVIDHYTNGKYFDKPTFMGGIFARYTRHPAFAFRLNLNYGTLYATDAWNEKKALEASSTETDAFQRYLRNQDIRANTWEGSLLVEFMPLRLNSENRSAWKVMQPYAVAGIGGFHFKPQTSVTDRITGATKWVDVHELRLEGDGVPGSKARKTSLWQPVVPVGLGLRWDLNPELAFGVEYLYRFTITDRLDNVSSQYATPGYYDRNLSPEKAAIAKEVYDKSWEINPNVQRQPWAIRGNKEVLDSYSTISLMIIYKITPNKLPWWY
jgi:hypothetical protein